MDSDINYIIRMSLNGDKNYQEILLQMLRPLIYKNIYSYWYPIDPLTEDLAQEGYALILESLKSFDENLNTHFLYYVKTRLIYFYKNYYRNNKQKNVKSINENNIHEAKNTLDIIIAKEEISELLINIKKLNANEQKILYLYYYQQLSMTEISEILSIPYRTTIGKKQTAVKKLKKILTCRRWSYGGFYYNNRKLRIPYCSHCILACTHWIKAFPINRINS